MFFFLYTILNVLKHLESVHRTFQCFPYKHANENMHENKHKNLKYQQVPVLNSVIWGLGSTVSKKVDFKNITENGSFFVC